MVSGFVEKDNNNFLESDKRIDIRDDVMCSFNQYLKEVSEINMMSDKEQSLLIDELVLLIRKLNELFLRFDCPLYFDNGRKLWICDKLDYCINNCNDVEILNDIKKLYDMFIVKRNMLIESNLRYVMWVAKKYYRKGSLEFEELIQYGNIGLIRAIESYNPKFDKSFIGYAKEWINQSIKANSKQVMYPIRLPMYLFEINNARLAATNYLSNKLKREPTNMEVANYMGITLEKLEFVIKSFYDYVSLDKDIELNFDDFLVDTSMMGLIVEEDNVFDEVFNNLMKEELNYCLDEFLDEREKNILIYKCEHNMSSLEVSSLVGVTRQRVEQIYHRAIDKLGSQCKVRDMRYYLR